MDNAFAAKKRGRKPAEPVIAGVPADAPVTSDTSVAAIVAAETAMAEVATVPVTDVVAQTAAEAPAADIDPNLLSVEPTASDEATLEGPAPMATTYDATTSAADNAKLLFGDFNERAKSAMEKSVKIGEELTEFTKGNVEAFVASGRVAAKGAETLAQDVADTLRKNFESTTATFKSFATVKSPTELFQLQSDYARSYFDGAVADASKFSESVMKLWGDIAQPLSSRYALAAEKFKATAI